MCRTDAARRKTAREAGCGVATHLHEVLPLCQTEGELETWQMDRFALAPGVCEDSKALEAAAAAGVPARAEIDGNASWGAPSPRRASRNALD